MKLASDIFVCVALLGAFPFIEASSPRKKGDVARLISRQFSSYYFSRCMTFHYHMMAFNQGHMGDFNVYMQQGSNDKVLLFSRKGPQGSEWIEQSLTLQSAKPYRVSDSAIISKDEITNDRYTLLQ